MQFVLRLMATKPLVGSMIGVVFAAIAAAGFIHSALEYRSFRKGPTYMDFNEAVAQAQTNKIYVRMEQPPFFLCGKYYRNKNETIIPVQMSGELIDIVVQYRSVVECEDVSRKPLQGTFTTMGSRRRSVLLKDGIPLSDKPLVFCADCGEKDAYGMLWVTGLSMLLGLLFIPSSYSLHRKLQAGKPSLFTKQ